MNNVKSANQHLNSFVMLLLGVAVGVIGGFGAVVFRLMIGFFHNLLFFGRFDLFYNANVHAAPSVWGAWIVLVPVVGALGVAWLVQTFAPEAKGHGVPEVIDAIYYNEGKIRPIVAFFKSLASALSIGSGGSVGREGPIVQIGSAFGSTLGQMIAMPIRQRVTLIAAGAGAGIAATFNAPIGGMVFAIELLLVSVNAATLSVVAVATLTATYIGRIFLGLDPAFNIPALAIPNLHVMGAASLLLFLPFGVLVGVASTIFIRLIYWFEDKFDALPMSYYLRHMLGMLMLGLMMLGFMHFSGHYYIQGVGYATIVDILKTVLQHPWFLLLLFFAKLLATSLTLGSGASGGIFSPGLFMGATLGGAFGGIAHLVFPNLPISPIVFAVGGMAGMVSGTTGAVVTAITMLFEMTRDYNAVLPIILTVTLAYLTRMALSRESIYTLKLLRRGHAVHEGLQAAMQAGQAIKHVMTKDFFMAKLSSLQANPEVVHNYFVEGKPVVVEKDEKIIGMLRPGFEVAPDHDAIDNNILYVNKDEAFLDVLRTMREYNMRFVIVSRAPESRDPSSILGVVTTEQITAAATDAALLMNESV
jgi:chloride channel protein, CIC family